MNQLTKIIRDVLKDADKHSMEIIKEACKVEFVKSLDIEKDMIRLKINDSKIENIEEESD